MDFSLLASEVPYLKQVTLHQMDHPQVTAVLTSLRTFFSMDYVQAGLFLTNQGYLDFWYSSCIPQLVAKLKGSKEVRLIVDQLNVNPYLPPSLGCRFSRWHMMVTMIATGPVWKHSSGYVNRRCHIPGDVAVAGSRNQRSSTPMSETQRDPERPRMRILSQHCAAFQHDFQGTQENKNAMQQSLRTILSEQCCDCC